SRSVRYVPVCGTHGSVPAVDRLKHPRGCCNEVAATAGNAGRWAIVAAWDTAVKKIIWHDKLSGIAEPATRHTTPSRASYSTVGHAAAHSAAVAALEKAEIGSGANGINTGVESVTANAHLPLDRSNWGAGKCH